VVRKKKLLLTKKLRRLKTELFGPSRKINPKTHHIKATPSPSSCCGDQQRLVLLTSETGMEVYLLAGQ